MHLKMLELTGFKSFAEARVEFPSGITAVVGPNGTGKSNVVDAILWVLGEQSTKTLRSDRMEDVIFNGTQLRKPLGMVEASLILSGMAEHLPPGIPVDMASIGGFSDIMITRRLYRNGDSEYLINKTACRLKDIRGLLLDTRAGIKGHSVIEQGRLQQILDASPQDRRTLIEETAGIVRYKKQKLEALRKLEGTQQNLLRVRDIIGEVRKQLNSLDRQARQAKTYQTLQQEARTLEIRLWAQDYRFLLYERSNVETELRTLEVQEATLTAEEAAGGVRLEEARLGLRTGEEAIGRIREELAQVEQKKAEALTTIEVQRRSQSLLAQQRAQAEQDISRLTEERNHANAKLTEVQTQLEQADADLIERESALAKLEESGQILERRRNEALEEEEHARRTILDIVMQVASAQNAQNELMRRLEEGTRRSDRLGMEKQDISAQYSAEEERLRSSHQQQVDMESRLCEQRRQEEIIRRQVQEGEGRLRESDHEIGQRQQELAAVASRLRTLQGVFREETGYGREGEEESTSLRQACRGLQEAVAEWLVVPQHLDRAIEAVLGERVRGWLVKKPAEAGEAIEFLKARGLGRGAFVPLTGRRQPMGKDSMSNWWPALQRQPGVLGRANELVRVRSESDHAVACLFERVVIVESLQIALRIWEDNSWSVQDGPTLVTLEGEIVEPSGVVTGGLLNPVYGVLQRRREIEQLEEKQATLAVSVNTQQVSRAELFKAGESLKDALQSLSEEIREAEKLLLAKSKEEATLKQAASHLAHRVETIQAEQVMAGEEQGLLEAELQAAGDRLAQVTEKHKSHEAAHCRAIEARQSIEADIQTWQRQSADERMHVEGLRTTLRHGRELQTGLTKRRDDSDMRIGELQQQIATVERDVLESQAELERKLVTFHEMQSEGERVQGALVLAQETYAMDLTRCREIEGDLARIREVLLAARKSRTVVEIRRAETATRMESLEGTLSGTYQLSVAEALLREPEPPAGETREVAEEARASLREELQRIREKVERMGPINLAAIDEHRELEERYGFLTTQEKDLTESIRSLKEIISRINRTTKEMFLETFNQLQEKFNEVFSRFFQGGRAELVLTEPEEGPESTERDSQDYPREPGVEIVAQPPGKRLKSISMLSGGEKTLTAMALIFASFLIKPTPFCILDEIDAPLDEENIGRFTKVLKDLAESAQFIVITHNKRTMAVADSLFGVTMEEPGVSKLVSVRLADLQLA